MAGKSSKKDTSTSNASASAFGWDFQANAAILLMLENIQQAKSIKVEAATEDIEITLDNNNIIYSQAKSIEDINSKSNLIEKLKDGIRTLNNAYNNGDAENLIYITNHSNPFNDKTSIQYFLGRKKYDYNDLPDKCKNKVLKIINENNYNLDTNKLKVYILPFLGRDRDNKDSAIKEAVSEFLESLEIYSSFTPKRMLEIWQRDFFQNATVPDNAIQIKKEKMIWTLIAETCEFDRLDRQLENCDDAAIDEIAHRYQSIINNKTEDFQFFNKVISDYSEFNKQLSLKERTEKFVNEEYVRYLEEFNVKELDDYMKSCLIKVIINKIISKRIIIDKIKKGANICN